MNPVLSAREMTISDIPFIVSYWTEADPEFLKGMGADPAKVPEAAMLTQRLQEQISLGYSEKPSYCIIWEVDGTPAGHCNVNNIIFGQEAQMHLHLWKPAERQKGWGSLLVKYSLPYFFNHLQLQRLYVEPYALNPAPNRTLEKVGFTFEKEYITIPGSLNFEQPVKLWTLTKDKFENSPKGII